MVPDSAEPTASGGDAQLSVNQRARLLFEGTRESRAVAFQLPRYVRVHGRLDATALETALHRIVERHSSLRTGFRPRAMPNESPGQSAGPWDPLKDVRFDAWIADRVTINLSAEGPDGESSFAQALDRAVVDAARPLALNRPPLVRVDIKACAGGHLLTIVVHHLVSDRWSVDVLEDELLSEYESIVQDGGSRLAVVPMQYSEFAHRQNSQLASGALDASLDYWRRQRDIYLDAQLRVKDLPFSIAGNTSGFEADEVSIVCDTAAEHRLREFVRQRRYTLFSVMLMALLAALHIYTQRRRVAVWAHFANRSGRDVGAVGWLANTHLLGSSCSPDISLDELLRRVQTTVLDACRHQQVPVGCLWATPRRDASGRTVAPFQTDASISFDFIARRRARRIADVTFEDVHAPRLVARVGLQIFARDTATGLVLAATYSRRRFDATGVRALLRAMEDIAVAAATHGTASLCQVEVPALAVGDVV